MKSKKHVFIDAAHNLYLKETLKSLKQLAAENYKRTDWWPGLNENDFASVEDAEESGYAAAQLCLEAEMEIEQQKESKK